MNRVDLAWAAGFFDGEGSVGCYLNPDARSYRTPRVSIQIAQTDPEVLEKFQEIVGVGNIQGPYSPKTKNSKPYWKYATEAFQNTQHIMCLLWSHLSTQKKNDFSKAMETYLTWANNGLCRNGHSVVDKQKCSTCRTEAAYKMWETRRNNA